MNKRKIEQKNLARITTWLSLNPLGVSILPNKIKKEIDKRYSSKYLGRKWRNIEQKAFELGLFEYTELLDEELFIPTIKGMKLILKYYRHEK